MSTAGTLRALAVAAALALAGCATVPGERAGADPGADAAASARAGVDPIEPVNRAVARFNDTLDDLLFRPVARVYDRAMPDVLRFMVRNFLSNLMDPYIGLNNLLQGKPREAASDFGRFVFNTVFGFFGVADPASDLGYEKHNEDFGQTLGVWGVGTGPYLVLPFLGPSTLRDAPARVVDGAGSPVSHLDDAGARNGLTGLDLIDLRARLLPADRLLDDALDRYLLIRDTYLQRRRSLVHDGNPPPSKDE